MSIDWTVVLVIGMGMVGWVGSFLCGYWKGHKDAGVVWQKGMEELGRYFRQTIK